MRPMTRWDRGEGGFSSGGGLVAAVVSLLLVAVLLMFSLNVFSGSNGTAGSSPGSPSILSRSSAENQIKLCSEGRDSTYGDPPSNAQQAACIHMLLGEISSGGPAVNGTP